MTSQGMEEATIRAFMAPSKRDRFVSLLANPKRRRKALSELNHFNDWDERFATLLRSNADLMAMLRAAGAPETCHLISNDSALDGRDMPLAEAVARADRFYFASVICCVPGRLALFPGEQPRKDVSPILLKRFDRDERFHDAVR